MHCWIRPDRSSPKRNLKKNCMAGMKKSRATRSMFTFITCGKSLGVTLSRTFEASDTRWQTSHDDYSPETVDRIAGWNTGLHIDCRHSHVFARTGRSQRVIRLPVEAGGWIVARPALLSRKDAGHRRLRRGYRHSGVGPKRNPALYLSACFIPASLS